MKKKFSIRVRPECRTLCGVSKDKKRRSLLLIFALFLSSSCFAADHAHEQSFPQRALEIVRSEISSHKKPLIATSLALLLRVYNLFYNPLYKNQSFDLLEIIRLFLTAGATYKEARDLQSSPSKFDFINKKRILALITTVLSVYLTDKTVNFDVKTIYKAICIFSLFIRNYPIWSVYIQFASQLIFNAREVEHRIKNFCDNIEPYITPDLLKRPRIQARVGPSTPADNLRRLLTDCANGGYSQYYYSQIKDILAHNNILDFDPLDIYCSSKDSRFIDDHNLLELLVSECHNKEARLTDSINSGFIDIVEVLIKHKTVINPEVITACYETYTHNYDPYNRERNKRYIGIIELLIRNCSNECILQVAQTLQINEFSPVVDDPTGIKLIFKNEIIARLSRG